VPERPELRLVEVGAMPGELEIGAQPRRDLRVDRERIAPPALARHPQGIIATVLVQIADRERRDLGAPQPDLQADRQDGAIAQSGDRIFGRQVEQFARFGFRKAAVEPLSRLIAGRSTSPTGLRPAWPWRTWCL
jgi:hypothetical protein